MPCLAEVEPTLATTIGQLLPSHSTGSSYTTLELQSSLLHPEVNGTCRSILLNAPSACSTYRITGSMAAPTANGNMLPCTPAASMNVSTVHTSDKQHCLSRPPTLYHLQVGVVEPVVRVQPACVPVCHMLPGVGVQEGPAGVPVLLPARHHVLHAVCAQLLDRGRAGPCQCAR